MHEATVLRLSRLTGQSLTARALRGTGLTILSIAGSNLLRFGSNLILTRLLFPEAFGVMALVQAFVQGLKMLSDTGVIPSIVRSERGDDPDFLNTAWTVQAGRGLLLWLGTCLLAFPLAHFYGEADLVLILPVSGISVLIAGFTTTKTATANRHLALGRLTLINLATQALGIFVMVILAWIWPTVWALVIGGLISSAITVLAQHALLPGIRNQLCWDREASRELFGFGRFIFLSSALGFLINQGDKLVLGRYLEMADFGVYNIGFMLATLPFMVSKAVDGAVLFPLYRHRPITEGTENRSKVFRARRIVLSGALTLTAALAFAGVPLVDLLYDPRYSLAGPAVVLICLASVPQIVVASYGSVLLAVGDSRSLFLLVLVGAILQIACLLLGVTLAGTFGVILAPAAVSLLLSPLRVWLLRRHQGLDPIGDLFLNAFGLGLTGLACWLHWDQVVLLIG